MDPKTTLLSQKNVTFLFYHLRPKVFRLKVMASISSKAILSSGSGGKTVCTYWNWLVLPESLTTQPAPVSEASVHTRTGQSRSCSPDKFRTKTFLRQTPKSPSRSSLNHNNELLNSVESIPLYVFLARDLVKTEFNIALPNAPQMALRLQLNLPHRLDYAPGYKQLSDKCRHNQKTNFSRLYSERPNCTPSLCKLKTIPKKMMVYPNSHFSRLNLAPRQSTPRKSPMSHNNWESPRNQGHT